MPSMSRWPTEKKTKRFDFRVVVAIGRVLEHLEPVTIPMDEP